VSLKKRVLIKKQNVKNYVSSILKKRSILMKTKSKYNNNSMYFTDWDTKHLKEYSLSLHNSIYGVNSCYGTKDMMNLDSCLNELEKRGYQIEETQQLHIGKWRS
jgi:hypothetical protein